jgi:hypothetical protein
MVAVMSHLMMVEREKGRNINFLKIDYITYN